eukprot:g44079.t1
MGIPQTGCKWCYSGMGVRTLFLIYINDLEMGVEGKISKFADNTKLGRIVDCEDYAVRLQKDVDKLTKWADTWQMNFNTKKEKITGDLIEVIKIMNNFDRVKKGVLFPLLGMSVTRGHSFKTVSKRARR